MSLSVSDLGNVPEVARAIAAMALGHDAGPMTTVTSRSHSVYVGAEAVVKLIDAAGHSRLEREIALVPQLPTGLMAPLLASGHYRLGARDVRYACYLRMPGESPGMGMPGMDEETARAVADDAVKRLKVLHTWMPTGHAELILCDHLEYGGFVDQTTLRHAIEGLANMDVREVLSRQLLDGLDSIVERASSRARVDVPVHADCHWGNWLVRDRTVTALLDFEWAHFGDPFDDWFFLSRFSGPHVATVLDVIAQATDTPLEALRVECEAREASHLVSDLRIALEQPHVNGYMIAERLRGLEELIVEQTWWRDAR